VLEAERLDSVFACTLFFFYSSGQVFLKDCFVDLEEMSWLELLHDHFKSFLSFDALTLLSFFLSLTHFPEDKEIFYGDFSLSD